ncbi:MAG: PadR family transcriptional regulator [Chloroflexota bacterium]|nr:PadR family transcriptional regulator [Chloroflexota bacterium]
MILASLTAESRHGHAIMRDIEDFAGVRLGPGTLYGALQRLERDGLIEAVPSNDRRQPYRLTLVGTKALSARLEAFATVIRTAEQRLDTR